MLPTESIIHTKCQTWGPIIYELPLLKMDSQRHQLKRAKGFMDNLSAENS
jgi:hypothetical protein